MAWQDESLLQLRGRRVSAREVVALLDAYQVDVDDVVQFEGNRFTVRNVSDWLKSDMPPASVLARAQSGSSPGTPSPAVDGKLRLGAQLARGGEGSILLVQGREGEVAKVYHKRPDTLRQDKLAAMVRCRTPALESVAAWPRSLIKGRDGQIAGFTMRRVEGFKDVHYLYGPATRRQHFPGADFRFLVATAGNIARAFAQVHGAGCVIGDVNHGSVGVSSKATACLFDVDSFQFTHEGKTYPCLVGVEVFTPPELQGARLSEVRRTPQHDAFCLAVLIFKLLMLGRHPYMGIPPRGARDISPGQLIREHRFVYGQRAAALGAFAPPPGVPRMTQLGPLISGMFESAFSPDAPVRGRPSAAQWVEALGALGKGLVACPVNPAHVHAGVGACPWCPIEQATGAVLFGGAEPARRVGSAPGTAGDAASLWRSICAIAPPVDPTSSLAPVGMPPPSELARSAQQTRYLCVAAVVGSVVGLFSINEGWWLWAGIGALAGWRLAQDPPQRAQINEALTQAIADWNALYRQMEAQQQRWREALGAMAEAHKVIEGLAEERRTRMHRLTLDAERRAMQAFLENFDIEPGTIPGIGPARVATLQSFGITTAADVRRDVLAQIPGFGSALAQRVVEWRDRLAARFPFNGARGVDPREIARLDDDLRARNARAMDVLRGGAAKLVALKADIDLQQQRLLPRLQEAAARRLQAQVDRQAVG